MSNSRTADHVRTWGTALFLILFTVFAFHSLSSQPLKECATSPCTACESRDSFSDQPVLQTVANDGSDSKHQPAPAWQLNDVNGKPVKLSDFRGKIVILDFWATWCPPCREEIPGFIALQKKYADKGVTVVGVSLDEGGPAAVKAFSKQNGINYPVVMGTQEIAAAYGGISAIPTTFLIDRKGNVAAVHEGMTQMAEFENEINQLL